MEEKRSFLTGIVEGFLRGNLPVLIILVSLIAGVLALMVTPREEEPQIVVPLADVMIAYPGGSAEDVERLVASRLERLLYQIDGVEYVYSMSRPGMAVVTVRFFVGEDREDSLLKLYNKLNQNMDQVTPGIMGWIVKPIEIDDVPIVNATLHSAAYDTHQLYRVAEEVVSKLQHVASSARITIHGGEPRIAHVYMDPERLTAYGLSPQELMGALQVSNVQGATGSFTQGNEAIEVEAGPFLRSVEELRNVMVGVFQDRPIYLRDVAKIVDGPSETQTYSRFSTGPAASVASRRAGPAASVASRRAGPAAGVLAVNVPSVTIAVAKKKGSNAVWVARKVQDVLDGLRGSIIPDDVEVQITRDYGETANDKVNNLVYSLALAVITVIGLLALTMSWREGLIVALAVPITYSLTLLCNYLLGYTINRVTLFALILALGLLVDDPIAGVENIERHFKLAKHPKLKAVVNAMSEIMPPIVLSTLAIIIAFTPMFFITGMMGPYMAPMALNVPIAVLMSTVVALTVTPWLSSKLLKYGAADKTKSTDVRTTRVYRFYTGLVSPFIESRGRSRMLMIVVALLFAGSVALTLTGLVPLKMLPFDNKNEFQVLVDMPESTTLETTDAVVRELEDYLRTIPEVTDFTTIVGSGSPMDFNGMVRHYYLRQGSNVADIRVNLLHRDDRKMDSHALVLRIRNDVAAIAERTGASVKLIEVPPGPPVLSTIVAEIYGQPHHSYDELVAAAQTVKAQMATEEGIVDLDDSVEQKQRRLSFEVDRDKAGRNGISVQAVVATLQAALAGQNAGIIHVPTEQNELPIVLRLPRADRSSVALLKTIAVKGRQGNVVQLGELGMFHEKVVDKTIFHKNQERVVYVTSEIAGRGPAYAVLNLQSHFKENPLPEGITADWRGEGEWKITLDVFRDLGIAFSIALLGIYILLVYETASYLLPVIIMLSIPLTMIGIMPGFWLLNVIVNRPVGGFANPVFFTATAMIGMIALCGIVVRNAIVLIDFIRQSRDRGESLHDAIIESGAVRLRPIVLTAGTTMLGAWPITFDPIFSGLAWSIIFGLFVSTVFTLVVIPVVYNMIYGKTQN
jgi:multidrug efflux pump subunit AcrB